MANLLKPTMRLRWVDVSTIPQISTEWRLQQFWLTTDEDEGPGAWVDIPRAGHINEAAKTTLQ